ncbi:MAG: LPS export ABC transporter periplasmic protein LptC [Burkholderiaceae bacterium]|nr:LPS export ABC transporter periplasmic protein LptC [Burkholderiaceae bacterium]
MKTRTYDRLAAVLSLALLLTLAAGTYYLAQISMHAGASPRAPAPGKPDYFIDGAVFTRINLQGAPVFRMSAQHMLHVPADDSTSYRQPEMVSLDPEQPRLTLRADSGQSSADGVETLLTGNVVMVRAATDDEPPMTIHTERVTIFSDTEIARTDLPVRIERGTSVLTGVGMEFNNAARSLRVDSRVHLTWPPPPQRSP